MMIITKDKNKKEKLEYMVGSVILSEETTILRPFLFIVAT